MKRLNGRVAIITGPAGGMEKAEAEIILIKLRDGNYVLSGFQVNKE
jgi:NAD(P)-dependent dehydrogenase (short-subunit alcohol dehydrogenase family)